MFPTVTIVFILIASSSATGIGKAWDISPSRETPEATTVSAWPRLNLSAFEVRSISGIGHLNTRDLAPTTKRIFLYPQALESNSDSNKNNIVNEAEDMENTGTPEILYDHPIFKSIFKQPVRDVEMLSETWGKSRRRGRTGRNRGFCPESLEDDEESTDDADDHPRLRRSPEETQLEKMSATKNVREPRLGSPESWSTQPLSVEFRHRTNLDGLNADEDDATRTSTRLQQAPQVDFVTANRRSFDTRESRDLPLSRSYDVGPYRSLNSLRDVNMPYQKDYYYPDHIRTEREYYIRGLNEPAAYTSDRYRIEDFDMYRNRPTPKPKRIIYYATLPEVVRKPVDLRTYTRPYDSIGRATGSMARDGIYKRIPMLDSRYRYINYPYGGYDTYDNYMKRAGYMDRDFVPYNDRIQEDRYREQDLDHASFKEAPRTDEALNGNLSGAGVGRRGTDKLPWPVQIGTEISVKDNTRVSGRKIFGDHRQDFERFRPSTRIERDDNGETLGPGNDRN